MSSNIHKYNTRLACGELKRKKYVITDDSSEPSDSEDSNYSDNSNCSLSESENNSDDNNIKYDIIDSNKIDNNISSKDKVKYYMFLNKLFPSNFSKKKIENIKRQRLNFSNKKINKDFKFDFANEDLFTANNVYAINNNIKENVLNKEIKKK